MRVTIRRLAAHDHEPVRRLLAAAHLPTDDLADASITLFGAFDGDALAGAIGLQVCGPVGLLRSLVVAPGLRRSGIARQLCEHVFAESARLAIPELWLLTTDARDYFVRHGFEVVDRGDVPAAVRGTAQFASLCPSSAIVMRRRVTSAEA
jgi:amino-acid N-acetyltransferase